MNYKVFDTNDLAASYLAEALFKDIAQSDKSVINIALSGGTTPFILFRIWAKQYSQKMDWQKIHFYWVDERFVAPTSNESNFGNTKAALFDKISIPAKNIHRMHGENTPDNEVARYTAEILDHVPLKNGYPQFDIMLLGMGDDGHTASIFPNQLALMDLAEPVAVAQNPYNGQQRLTLTGRVINNTQNLIFLVTGSNKTKVLKQIFEKQLGFENYPAARVNPLSGHLSWILDNEAASFINI